jgi:multidrug efflux pump
MKEVSMKAQVGTFPPPPVPGIGTAGGFKIIVEDRGSMGLPAIQKYSDELIADSRKVKGFLNVFTAFRADTPMYYLDINRNKARALDVSIKEVNQTQQVYVGSTYVNNFNEFGRYWQVKLMAEGKFRNDKRDIELLYARNNEGKMVPMGTLARMRDYPGPNMVLRYNLYPSAPITGIVFPTVSSGETIQIMDHLGRKDLPPKMMTEWTELYYMQILAGNTAMYIFTMAVVFVFLVLAAMYESWSLPLAIILVVPMCLLCAVVGVVLGRMPITIFTQIGFVVLVGLASKNAILIVEFAKTQRDEGKPANEAAIEACRLRLRPIMMTSFAFIFGVVPLVLAEGAGAEMRRALGTAVFSGMLGVTLFGIFLTPVFFYVLQWGGLGRLLSFRGAPWVSRVIVALLALAFIALCAYFAERRWLGALLGIGLIAAALLASLLRRRAPYRHAESPIMDSEFHEGRL